MGLLLFALGLAILAGGAVALNAELRATAATRRVGIRMRQFGRTLARADEGEGGVEPEGLVETIGRATLRSQQEFVELDALMRAAGRYDPAAPYWLAGLRILAAFGLAAAGGALGALATAGMWLFIGVMIGFAIGYLGPKYALSFIAAERRTKVTKELPFLIDMLLLLLRSGASIEQSFRSIAHESADGLDAIKVTIDRLIDDLDQGKEYEPSLHRWGARLAIEDGRELAALLVQSLTQGTELTTALRSFAEILIERRLHVARDTIGRRMTQLTVVMMLFFLPPLMIIITAPAVSKLLESFGRVGAGPS